LRRWRQEWRKTDYGAAGGLASWNYDREKCGGRKDGYFMRSFGLARLSTRREAPIAKAQATTME
jgi:hypothetical protein